MIKHGPQPYEGLIAVVCEAFGCTPAEAERQDWTLVQAVLDYRAAQSAIEIFNGPDKAQAFKVLQRNPYLLRVLAWMNRAQRGLPLEVAERHLQTEGLGVATEYRAEPESDDTEEGGS